MKTEKQRTSLDFFSSHPFSAHFLLGLVFFSWMWRTFKKNGIEKQYNKRIISPQYEKHLVDVSKVIKKDFWGFTNNKNFRFLKIIVKSLFLFNKLKFYFQSNKDGFKLYESNIDPFIRFIHLKNIKPCGWIKINNYSIDNEPPNTICDYNITADWNDIIPMDINKTAPFLIASFDIECTSSHGDFPVAIKNYKKLAQDLCSIAKANLDDGNLMTNIYNAYFNEVSIGHLKIHRLYPIRNEINEKETYKECERYTRRLR